ncbi:MAG: histidine utilization repressor [Rhizobiales bacterium PAR1]|nr:MAG: histidine utilization repressor [Rhizobiales bacterium PAR1]
MNIEAPLPRYLAIERDLQAKIASGEWGPGARVPAEHELQAQYDCSRMTVNKALSALAKAGLVIRKRRSGSFVASPKSQETILSIHDIKAEILATGRKYRFEILSREERRITAEDAARLAVPARGKVLALTVMHYAGNRPFVFEERLMNLSVVPAASTEAFEDSPPGTWLLNVVPWTNAEHVIQADLASPLIAEKLEIARKAACLVIERRTWQGEATITWVRLSYPGERHQLTSHFRPGGNVGV